MTSVVTDSKTDERANALRRARRFVGGQAFAQWTVNLAPEVQYQPLACVLSFVPDPIHVWPEADIRAIREKDPGFVPIFRKQIYKAKTGGLLIFRHHGVARYDRHRMPDPAVRGALAPVHGYFARFPGDRKPNVIERWFENKDHIKPGSIRARYNLPPPFILWGTWVRSWVEETYWAASTAEKRRYMAEHGEEARAAKERQAAEEEAAYIQKGEAAYQKRLKDSLGPADEKEAIGRQTGQWQEPPKPFVHLEKKRSA